MTPFDDDIGIEKLEQRLGVLVHQFKNLAQGMSDLPLYNHKVGVEAVDFMPFDGMGLGSLVTPWFINLVFLPIEPVTYDIGKIGKTALAELPAGQRSFSLGGDEITGMFWSHAVMSPLSAGMTHDAAVAMARRSLGEVLTYPDPERIRTSDLCLRRAALYPAELHARAIAHTGMHGNASNPANSTAYISRT